MTGDAADVVGVVDPTGRYHAAVAELPLSTRSAERVPGALVVIPGTAGWTDAALAASETGAAALVVAEPEFVPAAELRSLAQGLHIPLIIERPLLRADVAKDAIDRRAGESPRVLAVDGGAGAAGLLSVTRDAVGWLRVLAGGGLAVASSDGALALLQTEAGIAGTLTVTVTARPGPGWIRAHALGETITDVEIDGRAARVTTASAVGRLTSPTRFESSERLALRRAVAVLADRDRSDDLGELLADTDLVERMPGLAP